MSTVGRIVCFGLLLLSFESSSLHQLIKRRTLAVFYMLCVKTAEGKFCQSVYRHRKTHIHVTDLEKTKRSFGDHGFKVIVPKFPHS